RARPPNVFLLPSPRPGSTWRGHLISSSTEQIWRERPTSFSPASRKGPGSTRTPAATARNWTTTGTFPGATRSRCTPGTWDWYSCPTRKSVWSGPSIPSDLAISSRPLGRKPLAHPHRQLPRPRDRPVGDPAGGHQERTGHPHLAGAVHPAAADHRGGVADAGTARRARAVAGHGPGRTRGRRRPRRAGRAASRAVGRPRVRRPRQFSRLPVKAVSPPWH